MDEILRKVSTANEEEVDMLLTAVLARYGELYPDWEISTISLRGAKTGRNKWTERSECWNL